MKQHELYIVLQNGLEVISHFTEYRPAVVGEADAGIAIDNKLRHDAVYVYDLTENKLLKSADGKLRVPLGVEEVDREWFVAHGYGGVRHLGPYE